MPNLAALTLIISGGAQINARGNAPGNGSNITGVLNQLVFNNNQGSTLQINAGTGSGNATQAYYQARQLAPSANETISLSNSLPDLWGNTSANWGFTTIRAVYYQVAANANGSNISQSMTVGNAASPFSNFMGANTATVIVSANGPPYMNGNATGITVTPGTNHQTRIVNNDSANTLTYIIAIAGQ